MGYIRSCKTSSEEETDEQPCISGKGHLPSRETT